MSLHSKKTLRQIKFLDLAQEYKQLQDQINPLMEKIFASSAFIGGSYVQEFEENFAIFTQTKGCIGVGNGTDALEIALKALNLPEGSEIILPANTFIASLEAILNTGLKAVLIDCNQDYLINTDAIEDAITPNTTAIMPVHLYGRACDMEKISKIAKKHNLKIIEDCSQAHGCKTIYQGQIKSVGSIGDVGCFSFYPGKNLGAYGDGGGIVSNDIALLQKARSIANHGVKNDDKYQHFLIGRNSRLDSIQAGILNIKLAHLQASNSHRQNLAKIYQKKLSAIKNIFTPPPSNSIQSNVWHLYVIRFIQEWEGKRDIIAKFLQDSSIAYGIHYPHDLGSLEIVKSHKNCKIISNQNAQKYSSNILSLPIGTHITEEDIDFICQKFQNLIL